MNYRFQLRQIPFLFVIFAVTYLSVLPGPEVPGPQLSDKILHFIAYFGVAATAAFGFPAAGWRLAGAIVLWGIGIELVQWQMPTRMFELMDIVANSLGCVVGWQATRMVLGFIQARLQR